MPRPTIIITEDLAPAPLAWLSERCEVVRVPAQDGAALHTALANADALIVRTYTRVDESLLASAPRLRCVGRAGVGLDNIDVAACAARNIRVLHTPGANTQAVVEYTSALILDALRPRPSVTSALPLSEWSLVRRNAIAPRELASCVVGVLGMGRIGSRVARALQGLGTSVLYHDLLDIPPAARHGAALCSLQDLCARADILTIHIDPRESNKGFVSAPFLARCKPNLLLINTSRGSVVDVHALAAFLRANPSASASLDVHDPEPFGENYPLLNLANARLLPHLGAATRTAHEAMSWVVRDVWDALQSPA